MVFLLVIVRHFCDEFDKRITLYLRCVRDGATPKGLRGSPKADDVMSESPTAVAKNHIDAMHQVSTKNINGIEATGGTPKIK